MRSILKFFLNWASEASVTILTIASVIGAAGLIYLLTGRAPKEDMSWLMDYSSRCVAIALAITFTSVTREAFGHWFKTVDMVDKPVMVAVQSAKSLAVFLACLYVLTH